MAPARCCGAYVLHAHDERLCGSFALPANCARLYRLACTRKRRLSKRIVPICLFVLRGHRASHLAAVGCMPAGKRPPLIGRLGLSSGPLAEPLAVGTHSSGCTRAGCWRSARDSAPPISVGAAPLIGAARENHFGGLAGIGLLADKRAAAFVAAPRCQCLAAS